MNALHMQPVSPVSANRYENNDNQREVMMIMIMIPPSTLPSLFSRIKAEMNPEIQSTSCCKSNVLRLEMSSLGYSILKIEKSREMTKQLASS